MGFHKAGWIVGGIGLLILIPGILMSIGGGLMVGGSIENLETTEYNNSGSIDIVDNDGNGDLGFTFYVKGEYIDEDENGIWDHCESTNITITKTPDTNPEWDEGKGGEFYYEVLEGFRHRDSDDGNLSVACEADMENQNWDRRGEGLIKVGRACLGCLEGTVEFQSNTTVWVSYDDIVLEDLGSLLLGGTLAGIGASCACGGIPIIIIGLILGLALPTEPQGAQIQPAEYKSTSDAQQGKWI